MDDITDAFLGVDHITIPVRDLEVAERFYVDVLGGRVLGRIDAALLKSLGRPARMTSSSVAMREGPCYQAPEAGRLITWPLPHRNRTGGHARRPGQRRAWCSPDQPAQE